MAWMMGVAKFRYDRQTCQNSANKETYRVFHTKFDEVIAAADLCDPEELDRLRVMLDRHMENVACVVGTGKPFATQN